MYRILSRWVITCFFPFSFLFFFFFSDTTPCHQRILSYSTITKCLLSTAISISCPHYIAMTRKPQAAFRGSYLSLNSGWQSQWLTIRDVSQLPNLEDNAHAEPKNSLLQTSGILKCYTNWIVRMRDGGRRKCDLNFCAVAVRRLLSRYSYRGDPPTC